MNKNVSMEELAPVIDECLSAGGTFRLTVTGCSMTPTFWPGRDSVILAAPHKIKIHDVILYLRDDGTYVLHRVIGIKNGCFVLCGDNQYTPERGIRRDQVIAVVNGFYRNNKYIGKKNIPYRFIVFLWCISLSARPVISKAFYKMRRLFK